MISTEFARRLPVTANVRLTTAEFAVAATLLALSAYLLIGGLASSWATTSGLINEGGLAVGRDFTMFWSASALALEGRADSVYDFAVIRHMQGLLTGVPNPAYAGWLYPPTGLVLVSPLALLPYRGALVLWSLFGVAALGTVLWKQTRDPVSVAALLLFPAIGLCLINGQSGILLGALVGGGLLLLDRKPWLAGLAFGVATVKPQMLLLLVPCLVLGRHWRTLGAAAATFAGLVIASVLAFGISPWSHFFANVLAGVDILENVRPLERMPSVFVAASLAGASRGLAYALQIGSAVAALGAVGFLWTRRVPMAIRGPALLFGAPLVTPYSFDYDLSVLAVALGWLALEVARRGWLRGEKTLIALLWISPIAGWILAARTGVLVTPLVLAACLLLILRAYRSEAAAP